LAALGPMTLDQMVEYLRSPAEILLSDVKLLESIAILLPKLAPRIILTLTEIIDDLVEERTDARTRSKLCPKAAFADTRQIITRRCWRH
jgi:hypothetical protein